MVGPRVAPLDCVAATTPSPAGEPAQGWWQALPTAVTASTLALVTNTSKAINAFLTGTWTEPTFMPRGGASRQTGAAMSGFYDSTAWRRFRAQTLRQRPLCQVDGCGEASRHLDHRVPIRAGGAPTRPTCRRCARPATRARRRCPMAGTATDGARCRSERLVATSTGSWALWERNRVGPLRASARNSGGGSAARCHSTRR